MSFLDDLNRRTNQLNSQMGWPHFIDPDKTAQLNKESLAMANTHFVRLSELDSNPLAQAAAGEIIQELLRPREPGTEIHTDKRWCEDSFIRAGIYSTERQEYVWVNMERFDQWAEVAAAYPDSRCQMHNHPDCQYFNDDEPFTDELTAYPVKRGDNVPIFYACGTCRERLNNHSWTAEGYVQRGPLPWYDDGPEIADPESPWQ